MDATNKRQTDTRNVQKPARLYVCVGVRACVCSTLWFREKCLGMRESQSVSEKSEWIFVGNSVESKVCLALTNSSHKAAVLVIMDGRAAAGQKRQQAWEAAAKATSCRAKERRASSLKLPLDADEALTTVSERYSVQVDNLTSSGKRK